MIVISTISRYSVKFIFYIAHGSTSNTCYLLRSIAIVS